LLAANLFRWAALMNISTSIYAIHFGTKIESLVHQYTSHYIQLFTYMLCLFMQWCILSYSSQVLTLYKTSHPIQVLAHNHLYLYSCRADPFLVFMG
jgi:hypothetical protein